MTIFASAGFTPVHFCVFFIYQNNHTNQKFFFLRDVLLLRKKKVAYTQSWVEYL